MKKTFETERNSRYSSIVYCFVAYLGGIVIVFLLSFLSFVPIRTRARNGRRAVRNNQTRAVLSDTRKKDDIFN